MRQLDRRLQKNELEDERLDWKIEEEAKTALVEAEEEEGETRRKEREKEQNRQ